MKRKSENLALSGGSVKKWNIRTLPAKRIDQLVINKNNETIKFPKLNHIFPTL